MKRLTDDQLKASEEFRLLAQVTASAAKEMGERRYVVYGENNELIGNTELPSIPGRVVLEAYPGGRMILWNGRGK